LIGGSAAIYRRTVKIRDDSIAFFESSIMSAPAHSHDATPEHTPDATEAIVPLIPIVLPIVGGVLMFLLAFIAVSMA
jgi:hypothetical protein